MEWAIRKMPSAKGTAVGSFRFLKIHNDETGRGYFGNCPFFEAPRKVDTRERRRAERGGFYLNVA